MRRDRDAFGAPVARDNPEREGVSFSWWPILFAYLVLGGWGACFALGIQLPPEVAAGAATLVAVLMLRGPT